MLDLRRFVWIFLSFTVVALGVAYVIYDQHMPPEAMVTAADAPINPILMDTTLHHGIDISYHSGTVDWPTVKAQGFRFAFLKATEGDDLKDSTFASHWRQVKQAGLLRGAYHFYVTEDDPDTQAAFFMRNVTLEPGDLAPVVDIELIGHHTPKDSLAQRFQRFLSVIESHYGVKPIIYTTAKFWDEHFPGQFGDYPLWVAEYDVDVPRIPNGWDAWHLWQWQGDTLITGIEKGADITRINRDELELTDLIVGGEG